MPKRGCLKWGAYLFLALILVLVTLTVIAINMQLNCLIRPVRLTDMSMPAGVPHEDVTLTTADGLKISGWYIPGTRPDAVVLVHGIHVNRTGVQLEAGILMEAGYHLLLMDLRGHGRSEGEFATYGYNEALDVEAAVDYLLTLPAVKQVAVLGLSMGGAAAVRAAARDERVKAVVIGSSYSSLARAIEDSFEKMSVFPKWPFTPLLIALAEMKTGCKVSQVDSRRDLATMAPRPVFIFHSEDDDFFPVRHAQEMYEAAKDPKELWIMKGLPHGQQPVTGDQAEEYKRRLLRFLGRAFAGMTGQMSG